MTGFCNNLNQEEARSRKVGNPYKVKLFGSNYIKGPEHDILR